MTSSPAGGETPRGTSLGLTLEATADSVSEKLARAQRLLWEPQESFTGLEQYAVPRAGSQTRVQITSLLWHIKGWLDRGAVRGAEPALCLQRGQRHWENAVLLRPSSLPYLPAV